MNKIYNMDINKGIKLLKPNSINMTITSPPYWGLRDYGKNTEIIWNDGWKGQLGLEPTPDLYIQHLCDIYDKIKKVLKDTGTCWINLGDSYSGSGNGTWNPPDTYKSKQVYIMPKGTAVTNKKISIPKKSLCMIPFKFALEMVNRGWILRNVIIWHKPNAMPSSVKDRFTVDFEYLFFFVKNKKYYFEQQLEPLAESSKIDRRLNKGRYTYNGKLSKGNKKIQNTMCGFNSKGKNKRTVWSINTKGFPEAHFAVFPETLAETPIKAGCPIDGIVLDPFMGSGTTAIVAKRLNRNFIGFEINPEYVKIAEKRLKDDS